MTGGVSQVMSLVSTTLFARVSIRNESRGWSMPCPRSKLLSRLGNDFDGGSSGNTLDEETGAVMLVLPYHATCRMATCCPG